MTVIVVTCDTLSYKLTTGTTPHSTEEMIAPATPTSPTPGHGDTVTVLNQINPHVNKNIPKIRPAQVRHSEQVQAAHVYMFRRLS